jgi:hypothetical protein
MKPNVGLTGASSVQHNTNQNNTLLNPSVRMQSYRGIAMQPGITAIILICASTISRPDCSVDTATDMIQGFDANTPIECAMNSQALIAQSALSPGLGKDQYLKVICVQKERAVETFRVLEDDLGYALTAREAAHRP